MTEEIIKGSQSEVGRYLPELSLDIIKKFICPDATDQEAYAFLQLCKIQKLNPFLKEVYLIKYGKERANTVVAKDTFLKRAEHVSSYTGFKAGIIIVSHDAIIYREGSFMIGGETLLGGWAEVYRQDRTTPFRNEVSLQDFSKQAALWKTMPSVMIRKVALVQSLREAFPDELGGLYSQEEIPVGTLPDYEVGKHPDITYSGKPFVEPPQAKTDTGGEAKADNEIITSIEKIEEIKSKPDAVKKWVAYILICEGKKYGTYDKEIQKVAMAAMSSGQQVSLRWKQGKHNPEIVSLNIIKQAEDAGDIRDGELLPQDDKDLVTSTKLSAANFLTILKTCKTLVNFNKAWNEYWNEGYTAEEKSMLLEWKDKLTEGLKK